MCGREDGKESLVEMGKYSSHLPERHTDKAILGLLPRVSGYAGQYSIVLNAQTYIWKRAIVYSVF